MILEVCEPNPDDRPVILNLGTYYRYDLLPFVEDGVGARLNRLGAIGEESAATHEQGIAEQEIWWSKPDILLPMLICVGSEPAGFALVARPPHADPSVDYRMEDFFIINKFRGVGAGRSAVVEIFARCPGRWEIGWLPKNRPAESFWRSITAQWQPEDWLVPQAPGTPGLPGLRLAIGRR